MNSNISIIIPTLNEEINIDRLAVDGTVHNAYEVLIVDGGSQDKTCSKALDYGFSVFHSQKGRAHQLNHGAEQARGEILLFLHADTLLPLDFDQRITDVLSRKENRVGAFSLAIEDGTAAMNFVAVCANIRSRLMGLPYGDQAIFLTKQHFFSLGMYPNMPIMEDYEFMRIASRKGDVITLPEKVYTSARRWQRLGVLKTTIINQLVIIGYYLKIKPEKLRSLYNL